uniref:Ribosomal protein L5 n=1 Tax=Aureoumbra lagunensis TaxID=44058 RepID=A0A7U0QGH0_9STRA|nr:hypothetical protein K4Z71_mgp33 [Aureoumbra lagunensis]QQW50393.1 hypothetical protein [Aureoumbra lagunensis]
MWQVFSKNQKQRLYIEKGYFFCCANVHQFPNLGKVVLKVQVNNLKNFKSLLFILSVSQLFVKKKSFLLLMKPLNVVHSKGFPLGCKVSLNCKKAVLFCNYLIETFLVYEELKTSFTVQKNTRAVTVKLPFLKVARAFQNSIEANEFSFKFKVELFGKHNSRKNAFFLFYKLPFFPEKKT